MTTRISLLMPTRGRPALVERFFQSVVDTTSILDQVEVILCVDDDDVESHALGDARVKFTRLIGPRAPMGVLNTKCLKASSGDIIILVNDDMVFRTPGWDTTLIAVDASVADKIYLAYGNDLLKKGDLCTFPILSRHTCDLLIEPYPPEYRGAFIDVHLFDIFKRVKHAGFDRIIYREDVVLRLPAPSGRCGKGTGQSGDGGRYLYPRILGRYGLTAALAHLPVGVLYRALYARTRDVAI